MAEFLTAKAKHWGQAKIELPPRWEYVPKERSEKLRRPAGWYLFALTDCGYRWIALKDLKGKDIPEPPPEPAPPPKKVPEPEPAPPPPAPDPEPEPIPEDLPVQKDWRTAFLEAIEKM